MGNGRLQSVQCITAPLCCSCLLSLHPCSIMAPFHRLQCLSRKAALVWALHRLCFLQELLQCGAVHRLQWLSALVQILQGLQGISCFGTWSISSSLSSFSDLGVPPLVSHSSCCFLFLSVSGVFYLFLHTFSQMCYRLCWWTQLWPVMGLAGPGCDRPWAALSLFPQKPSLKPFCGQHLTTCTKYTSAYLKACRVTSRVKWINLDWLVYSDPQSKSMLAVSQQAGRKQKELSITVYRFL